MTFLYKSAISVLSMLTALGVCAADAAMQPESEPVAVPEAAEPVVAEYSSDWHLSAGISYRKFRSAHFKSASSGSFSGMLVTDGGVADPSSQEALKKAWQERGYPLTPGGIPRVLNFADYTGGSVSGSGSYVTRERLAPVLGLSTDIWNDGALSLAFVTNFQFFNMNSGSSASGGSVGRLDVYGHAVSYNHNGIFDVNANRPFPAVGNADGKINAVARTKFDMQLYVFDLGLSLGYDFDSGVRAYLSAGPTISIADMESHSFAAVTSNGNRIAGGSGRDNDVEFNFGLYAAAGASFWFNESYGISAEVRYDNGFGNVDTHYASQSLDSWGGVVKLNTRF